MTNVCDYDHWKPSGLRAEFESRKRGCVQQKSHDAAGEKCRNSPGEESLSLCNVYTHGSYFLTRRVWA